MELLIDYLLNCTPIKDAAEQKARSTYEYIINLIDDPDVKDPIRFLREREVVHFQRFGECLMLVEDFLSSKKNHYIQRPEFLN